MSLQYWGCVAYLKMDMILLAMGGRGKSKCPTKAGVCGSRDVCLCLGASSLPAGRLHWCSEGITAGSELGNGSCHFRTLHLCPASCYATLL